MGRPNTGVLTINGFPAKQGLMVAGHQQDIPETALWNAKNVSPNLDGLTSKRPSLHQWGQTLKEPDSGATDSTVVALIDFLNDSVGGLVGTDGSSGAITLSVNRGYLQYNVPSSAGSETYTHHFPGTSASTTWGFRGLLQGINLPAYTAAGTDPNSLAIRIAAGAGTGKEFVLWSGGLYYKRAADDQYTLVAGTTLLGLGAFRAVEILYDDAGNCLVYVDDTLVDTIAASLMKDVSLTSGALFETSVLVEGTGAADTAYNARVATLMYNDTDDTPFAAQEVVATTDFTYITQAGTTQSVVLAAAGNYIYVDRMEQNWRPLLAKQRRNVFFTTYQRTIVWSDNDGGTQASLWQWDGLTDPELLDQAPDFVLMTEHQQRLAGVDRSNPLLLLISGDRDPNAYIDPDNLAPTDDLFDLLLDACAIPIPAKKGDAITAVFGDFYGSLIVWTRTSVWRLTGNGVFSYALGNISQTAGCVNPNSVTMVGNDLWFLSFYGTHSLQATDQFGDIQTAQPSIAIMTMWQDGSRAPNHVNRELLESVGRLTYHRTRGLVYVHLPIAGRQCMIYSTSIQQWYGPWDVESMALASMELSSPRTEVVMHGGAAGKLAYTDFNRRSDYDTDSYESVWEHAALNGRSLDPSLVGQTKTFRRLRLYFLPRGAYDFAVRWYSGIGEGYQTVTVNQLQDVEKVYTVGVDMRVDVTPDGLVYSSEEMMIIEIEINTRGLSLDFDITDNTLGSDLAYMGFQLDFEIDGYEVEVG